jgi:hypothetical protein
VRHFPRTGLVAVDAAGERADGADIDAGAAFVALQVVAHVGSDLAGHAAVDDAKRAHAQALSADAHAAEAQDAARRIEEDHGGELLLGGVDFFFRVAAFASAVTERHVLQFALAALIADGAIQRVVGEQELEHVFARLSDLFGVGAHHHAFGNRQSACRHHLGHLLHFHQAHAAGGGQGESLVVAERGDLDADGLGGIDHQSLRRDLDGAAIDSQIDQVSH